MPAGEPEQTAAVPAPAGDALPRAAVLKAQPRSASETIAVVPAGTAVAPAGRISNHEGEWVYIQYGADAG